MNTTNTACQLTVLQLGLKQPLAMGDAGPVPESELPPAPPEMNYLAQRIMSGKPSGSESLAVVQAYCLAAAQPETYPDLTEEAQQWCRVRAFVYQNKSIPNKIPIVGEVVGGIAAGARVVQGVAKGVKRGAQFAEMASDKVKQIESGMMKDASRAQKIGKDFIANPNLHDAKRYRNELSSMVRHNADNVRKLISWR